MATRSTYQDNVQQAFEDEEKSIVTGIPSQNDIVAYPDVYLMLFY